MISEALAALRPGAQWSMDNEDLSTLKYYRYAADI